MEKTSIYPCWGKHQRMGHTVLYGRFTEGPGDTAVCTVPSIEETETEEGFAGETHIVPMSGPAFFGFQVLDEDTVMSRIHARHIYAKRLPQLQITVGDDEGGIEDAEELICDLEDRTESDSDEDLDDDSDEDAGSYGGPSGTPAPADADSDDIPF